MGEKSNHTEIQQRNRTAIYMLGAAICAAVLGIMLFAWTGGRERFAERQRLALQKGAAVDLAELLAKQSTFKAAHGVFTTDLLALGLVPKAVVYKIGFVMPSSHLVSDLPGHDASRKDLDAMLKARPNLPIKVSTATKLSEISFDRLASFCPDCTAHESTFKAVAAANLDGDPVLDVWTIDDKGEIRHLIDDLGGADTKPSSAL